MPRGGVRLRAQRMSEPVAQEAAAGRRAARVEQRKQRGRGIAAQGFRDLEVAPRRGVQSEKFARGLDGERAHVRERRLLGRGGVTQQRAGAAKTEIAVVDAERRQIVRAEMLRQRLGRGDGVELPRRQCACRHAFAPRERLRALGNEQLGHVQSIEHGRGIGRRHLGERELPRRQVEPRDARPMPARVDGDEQAVALGVEQIGIGHRARRDHAQDLALDRSLAGGGISDLFADRHGLAQLHQLREVAIDGVIGDAGHRDRRAGRLSARGQRDVEQARGALRIVVEELVEIAHPVEEQLVRMLRLGAEVLLHHGRMCRLQVLGGAQSSVDLVRQLKDLGPRIAANLFASSMVFDFRAGLCAGSVPIRSGAYPRAGRKSRLRPCESNARSLASLSPFPRCRPAPRSLSQRVALDIPLPLTYRRRPAAE